MALGLAAAAAALGLGAAAAFGLAAAAAAAAAVLGESAGAATLAVALFVYGVFIGEKRDMAVALPSGPTVFVAQYEFIGGPEFARVLGSRGRLARERFLANRAGHGADSRTDAQRLYGATGTGPDRSGEADPRAGLASGHGPGWHETWLGEPAVTGGAVDHVALVSSG